MTWTVEGKRAIVISPSSQSLARKLAERGADVVAYGEPGRFPPGPGIRSLPIDLESLDSVRAAASSFTDAYDEVHLLLFDYGMRSSHRDTADGYEFHFAVNYLTRFLFTNLLTDALIAGAPSRVGLSALRSSSWHAKKLDLDDLQMRKRYDASRAYYAADLAYAMFAEELDRRIGSRGVTVRASSSTDEVAFDEDVGDSVVVGLSRWAKKETNQAQLWAASSQLVGL
jgi:retinol dehydrogenase-13